jgi:cellulose 1,4-beta-cellobiosidase
VIDSDLRPDPFSIRISSAALSIPDSFFAVTELDDDTQSIYVTKVNGSGLCPMTASDFTGAWSDLAEGGNFKICVSLAFQPLSNTVVDVATSPSLLSRAPASLAFSTSDYATPQLVTITAGSDSDARAEAGKVDLTSSGFAATRTLTFDVTDPDTLDQKLIFTGLAGTATPANAGTLTFTTPVSSTTINTVKVKLAYDPISTVTLTCVSDGSPVFITGSSSGVYTFTGGSGGTYPTFQSIPLFISSSAVAGDSINVTCTPAGGDPTIAGRTFTVVFQ